MFRISLDALLVLDAIDRLGSFAAAGNELFKVPSTISYTISKLEDDLGVKIFERQGPKVSLTTPGAELLKEGRYLLKAAGDLEQRVRRVASGWETELAIGMDTMFSPAVLADDIKDFYTVAGKTRLRISQESLSGTWEALLNGRVDILIGAAGEPPSGGGYSLHKLGTMDFVFAVAPQHPLANLNYPLGKDDLSPHRAIVVSDSVRQMAPKTIGVLFGQDNLAVPNMRCKLEYQVAGIGFGFLPDFIARPYIDAGVLIEKSVIEHRQQEEVYLAWRSDATGEGLKWWIERMKQADHFEAFKITLPRQ